MTSESRPEDRSTYAVRPQDAAAGEVKLNCPRCETVMEHVSETPRVSWGKVLDGPHRPDWYYGFMGGHGHGRAYHWYRNGY